MRNAWTAPCKRCLHYTTYRIEDVDFDHGFGEVACRVCEKPIIHPGPKPDLSTEERWQAVATLRGLGVGWPALAEGFGFKDAASIRAGYRRWQSRPPSGMQPPVVAKSSVKADAPDRRHRRVARLRRARFSWKVIAKELGYSSAESARTAHAEWVKRGGR